MNDPIADMLSRIRNGQQARKRSVRCPRSRMKERVLDVLKSEGFIRGYKSVDIGNNRIDLDIELKYNGTEGVISQIDRMSKPGRRTYYSAKDLPSFHNGLGVVVVSTPNGILSDHQARSENVGGEAICRVF
jgi:small subunit ribosomal protein S8